MQTAPLSLPCSGAFLDFGIESVADMCDPALISDAELVDDLGALTPGSLALPRACAELA